jgi:hypothetical protein
MHKHERSFYSPTERPSSFLVCGTNVKKIKTGGCWKGKLLHGCPTFAIGDLDRGGVCNPGLWIPSTVWHISPVRLETHFNFCERNWRQIINERNLSNPTFPLHTCWMALKSNRLPTLLIYKVVNFLKPFQTPLAAWKQIFTLGFQTPLWLPTRITFFPPVPFLLLLCFFITFFFLPLNRTTNDHDKRRTTTHAR